MITLYPSTATAFETQGLGALPDAISCQVTEERNGAFELTIEYPITGLHYADISNRCIITAKPNPYDEPEPFRIYQISKPIGGRVKISAQHLSYDLTGIPVSPYEAGNAAAALQGIKSNAAVDCPFVFWTDKTTQADFKSDVPASARALLGGQAGSILDVYGGEYAWQGYTIRLYNQRGQDNGVSIRYGKNLTDLTQEENVAAVATGVYPYWLGSDGTIVEAPGKIVNAPGTYNFTRVIPLDVSQDFDAKPTPEEVKARAEKYVQDNHIGIPKVSITVAFQPLEQTEEYKDIAILERVRLCDTVTVEYPELGVDATAKCIKTTYDVIKGKYASVELGDAKSNITATIANQEAELKKVPSSSTIEAIANAITEDILGAKGGAVRVLDTDGDKKPDTLYIADNPDPAQAVKVWRYNYEGWAASSSGYNGPFTIAASIDHGMYADFLTAGTLNANLVQITGMIINPDYPGTFWNLATGEASFNYLSSKMAYNLLKLWIGKGGGGEYGVILTNDNKVRISIEPSWGTGEEPITAESDYVDIYGPDQYTNIRLGHKDASRGLLEMSVGGSDASGYMGTYSASVAPGELWMLCEDSQGNSNEIAITGDNISTSKDITAAGISIQDLERRIAALENK